MSVIVGANGLRQASVFLHPYMVDTVHNIRHLQVRCLQDFANPKIADKLSESFEGCRPVILGGIDAGHNYLLSAKLFQQVDGKGALCVGLEYSLRWIKVHEPLEADGVKPGQILDAFRDLVNLVGLQHQCLYVMTVADILWQHFHLVIVQDKRLQTFALAYGVWQNP